MIKEILKEVFHYKKHDKIIILYDIFKTSDPDYLFRIKFAKKWYNEIKKLGYEVKIASYIATNVHNADFPDTCYLDDKEITFDTLFKGVKIVIALTEFSPTAPLTIFAKKYFFHAVTMPGFNKRMMPALEIPLSIIRNKVSKVYDVLKDSESITIKFDNSKLFVDTQGSTPVKDDGQFTDANVINLPTGEAFIAPKEFDSETKGGLSINNKIYTVKGNRIVDCDESNNQLLKKIKTDEMIGNIAEIGFGVLGSFGIKPDGNILLDEKLGLHIALGRSEHLNGKVSPKEFKKKENVWHQDFVYLDGIKQITVKKNNKEILLMKDSKYTIF